MSKHKAVTYVTAWVAILLALGLLDYAHLHTGASHSRVASTTHVPSQGTKPTTSPSTTTRVTSPLATTRPPATTSPATTRPNRTTPLTTSPTGTGAAPVAHRPNQATPAAPALPAAPVTRVNPASATPAKVAASPPTAVQLTYVVQPNDTLWSLAADHLGNPRLWPELFALNRGRPQPGGQTLVNPDLIYAGWTLEFPPWAIGLASAVQTPHQGAGSMTSSTQETEPTHVEPPNGQGS
jgi:LysM repeat protein